MFNAEKIIEKIKIGWVVWYAIWGYDIKDKKQKETVLINLYCLCQIIIAQSIFNKTDVYEDARNHYRNQKSLLKTDERN